MMTQHEITLKPQPRGFHVITQEVLDAVPEIAEAPVGMLHVFIRHTSASLSLNENASRDVLHDFEEHFNEMVPENAPYYRHTIEGSDDMPAHIKASLLGSGVWIPIRDGSPALGTWQGIYLCEHRNHGGPRKLVVTVVE